MDRKASLLTQLIAGKKSGATLWVILICALCLRGAAQTVQVDATPSHVVNKFSPLYALGSTVDRVPSNATDMFFRPDQIQQVRSAGWGVIS